MSTNARRLIALTLATSLLGSCAGYLPVAVGPVAPPTPPQAPGPLAAGPAALSRPIQAPGRLAVGQTVRVVLRDAPPAVMTIREIQPDALVGTRGEHIPWAAVVAITSVRPAGNYARLVAYCAAVLLQVFVFAFYHE
jgi:hypothetical protein